MQIRVKIQNLFILVSLLWVMQTAVLNASETAYQEDASDVIMNSIGTQPSGSFLRTLYKQLFFIPVWMHEKGLSQSAKVLFAHIKNDKTLDKTGKLYQDAQFLEQRAKEIYAAEEPITQKIDLEFRISQLYEAYTNYAYLGSINWGAFNARISNLMVNDVSTEWVLHRPSFDATATLENVAMGASLESELTNAIPTKYRYKALEKELIKYREIKENGGWHPIIMAHKFKRGKPNEAVPNLRERLRATGDYTPCKKGKETLVYDRCLQKAVKNFQKRHGLKADGDIGSSTLKQLNKTVDERITSILLNLDRIKWLKQRHERRHIVINIPDFMLSFEEDGKLIQSIKTVVGRPTNPTPIFSNRVRTIVLNPYWNLPTSIIQKEMIPKLIRNPNAMAKKGIEIRAGWGKDAKKINPKSVDWAQYMYSKVVPFRFAQLPGPRNALGKIKFLFPNKFSVYMHDTPAKKLFYKKVRAFSHGCIRLQKPRELLKTFSNFNSNIDFNQSQKILKGKKKTFISLEETVPVDVVYLTAWVDYDGKLQFRDDIYGYDRMQLKSFRKW